MLTVFGQTFAPAGQREKTASARRPKAHSGDRRENPTGECDCSGVQEERVGMSRKNLRFRNRPRACRVGICAIAWLAAVAIGCSDEDVDSNASPASPDAAGAGSGSVDSGGTGGNPSPSDAGTQVAPG